MSYFTLNGLLQASILFLVSNEHQANIKFIFVGSSTACILILEHESNNLFTVNIGDSGFLVVRKGRVVHKSEEQQHYFNTPFQLALPPPGHHGSALSDR